MSPRRQSVADPEERKKERMIIDENHCKSCGSTEPEDIDTGTDPEFQGYSRCCNEPVVWNCSQDVCTHE